jgi:TetR/AcrR family transcriptional regulator, transcriptional repressor for nem operon
VKVALQNMLNSLERILHSGINKDEFKMEIDVKAEAEHIFAQIEGAILMAKLMDDPMLLNRALDRLKSHIMQNVKK